MKILLLGKNGLLGSEILKVLQTTDHEITSFDKTDLNLQHLDEIFSKINKLKPKIIINATGYTKVDEAETHQALAKLLNEEAVANIAKAAQKLSAKLIHFSTDYVFDGDKGSGYTEDDIKNPLSIYGASKAAGEQVVLDNCKRFFIVRTSWLYGSGGKNFVDTMLNLGKEKDELSVVSDQIGSPTYALDLAQALPQFFDSKNYGIYHLTNTGAVTWYDFAKTIFNLKKMAVTVVPITTDQLARPAKRPKCSILINTKLPQLRDWKEAVREYLGVTGN